MSTHHTYEEMAALAIYSLADRSGSSQPAIESFILARFPGLSYRRYCLRHALKTGIARGHFKTHHYHARSYLLTSYARAELRRQMGDERDELEDILSKPAAATAKARKSKKAQAAEEELTRAMKVLTGKHWTKASVSGATALAEGKPKTGLKKKSAKKTKTKTKTKVASKKKHTAAKKKAAKKSKPAAKKQKGTRVYTKPKAAAAAAAAAPAAAAAAAAPAGFGFGVTTAAIAAAAPAGPITAPVSISAEPEVDGHAMLTKRDACRVLPEVGGAFYDCNLVFVDMDKHVDRFIIGQVIWRTDKDWYFCYSRSGETGTVGKTDMLGPYNSANDAITVFEDKFREATGNTWMQRDNFETKPGKYRLLKPNYAPPGDAKWQYYIDAPVDGKMPGWYDYDTAASDIVEQVYGEWIHNAGLDVRAVRSGHWQYKVDFDQMKQTNLEHYAHTARTIRRALK